MGARDVFPFLPKMCDEIVLVLARCQERHCYCLMSEQSWDTVLRFERLSDGE
jgi:hypothetical protein